MGKADSFQLQNGGKSCWFDCHRQFLPRDHPFRRDRRGFKAATTVTSTPPLELMGDQIWEQIRGFPTVYEGNPYKTSNKKLEGFGITHNWVKRSIFWELPYWRSLLIRHNLDLMHIEKNVFENLFNTIMDTPRTKDNVKARKDIALYCDRSELHIFKQGNREMKPKASYTMSKPQVKKVCEWLTTVKFPDRYASNIKGCVNVKDWSFYSFKSHECHVFMQRLLCHQRYDTRCNMGCNNRVVHFFRVICSRVLHIDDLKKIKISIVETICKLEKVFPPGFFDSMEHLQYICLMKLFSVVRRNIDGCIFLKGKLKRTVRNKARVEGSIVESYRID